MELLLSKSNSFRKSEKWWNKEQIKKLIKLKEKTYRIDLIFGKHVHILFLF